MFIGSILAIATYMLNAIYFLSIIWLSYMSHYMTSILKNAQYSLSRSGTVTAFSFFYIFSHFFFPVSCLIVLVHYEKDYYEQVHLYHHIN